MSEHNLRVVLRRRPVGLVSSDDVEIVEAPVPEMGENQALVRNSFIGIDAAVRTWLEDTPGYLPPVGLGEVVRAGSVAEVIATNCPAYEVGDVVTTLSGFEQFALVNDDMFTTKVPREVDRVSMLSIFGSTGATAYFGMHDIGQPQEGETVVVSAAAGATGSLVGQIAKIHGARAVGIAGSDEKCRVVVDEFGFDSCINYRDGDLGTALKEHCPKRIDVYFDNVGGPILDAVLGRLNMHARVVLCGVISSYLDHEHPGPSNYVNLLARRAKMQGFNTLDEWGRYDEAFAALQGWYDDGKLTSKAQIFEGLESGVDALNALFLGTNIGKTVLRP